MNKSYCSVNNWLIESDSGSIFHLITGERKRLGEYQLKLLQVLANNAGKTLTREELTSLVWERRVIGNNSLPNAIHALRVALEDDGKQQRIIKTVPRKGYLLDAAYCREAETTPEDIAENAAQSLMDPGIPEDQRGHANQNTTAPGGLSRRWWQRWQSILLAALLALAATSFGLWRYFDARQNDLVYEEQAANIYSHIRLYEIAPANSMGSSKDQLYNKLKGSFYQINQQLKARAITMNIYYQIIDQTLNYSFALENKCDNKQLAMTIYHWRIDARRLNNLILSESQRKIGEMEICRLG